MQMQRGEDEQASKCTEFALQGHAHLETARREPWLFGEPTTTWIRDAIRARYALLPYIYTLFRHANLTGRLSKTCLTGELYTHWGALHATALDIYTAFRQANLIGGLLLSRNHVGLK